MNNAVYNFALPENEEVKTYLKNSPERKALEAELKKQSSQIVEIPLIINGKEILTGNTGEVRMPHDHKKIIARYHKAGKKEIELAVKSAVAANKEWAETAWTIRASILLKAAELMSTKYRAVLNAATMLGQSKNIFQAEIDCVCEAIDFLKYNAYFAGEIYSVQPRSTYNQLNRMEFRALEGFVFTVSPFNFTAIASNLNMAPIMMGNTTVWKPATTSLLSNYYLMKIFQEAGIPDGVINFLPGEGSLIGENVIKSPDLAGIHFTGSNRTFNGLWKNVAEHLPEYRSYPRLVGETGGKNFIFVHPSADPLDVAINAVKGAFEFQGQKCSAASRMYIPKSLYKKVTQLMVKMTEEIKVGDVQDVSNFMNAVIDEKAFNTITGYIEYAKSSKDAKIIAGGTYDKSKGYFIRPTIVETTDPHFKLMEEEIFGPVLCIYQYNDNDIEKMLDICDKTSPYGLTGAIFAKDRIAAAKMCEKLTYSAGNFYINDKPTGAVVGLQPFGGARASGTNDKAGGQFNLIRWTSPRTIKETFVNPSDYRYPYMKE